jgi:hypothetical protein
MRARFGAMHQATNQNNERNSHDSSRIPRITGPRNITCTAANERGLTRAKAAPCSQRRLLRLRRRLAR